MSSPRFCAESIMIAPRAWRELLTLLGRFCSDANQVRSLPCQTLVTTEVSRRVITCATIRRVPAISRPELSLSCLSLASSCTAQAAIVRRQQVTRPPRLPAGANALRCLPSPRRPCPAIQCDPAGAINGSPASAGPFFAARAPSAALEPLWKSCGKLWVVILTDFVIF